MRFCVRWLDRALRQHLGVIEYCQQPPCLLRVAPARSDLSFTLPDGTAIARGDPLLELHLWNERLQCAGGFPSSLGRGGSLRARLDWSLVALARYVSGAEAAADIRACHARFAFRLGSRRETFVQVAHQLGFTVAPDPPPSLARAAAEHGLVLALQWTYNPGVLHQSSYRFDRLHLWMSRRALLARCHMKEGRVGVGPHAH